jgi:hypothetical protein
MVMKIYQIGLKKLLKSIPVFPESPLSNTLVEKEKKNNKKNERKENILIGWDLERDLKL